jgi:hypothetical protein
MTRIVSYVHRYKRPPPTVERHTTSPDIYCTGDRVIWDGEAGRKGRGRLRGVLDEQ